MCIRDRDKINNENPFMTVLTGDYNAKNSSWYSGDKTDKYGLAISDIFSANALSQIVDQPTNITATSHHCIDLVATDQPNIIIQNEIAPSLDPNCHHQINLVKLNLKCQPPPPYKRLVYHYARANVTALRESCRQFDWTNALLAHSDSIDEQVELFDNTVLNIASNFIPNNEKLFVPKDPPWLTKTCKTLYKKYHRKFQRFTKGGYKPEEKKKIDELREKYTNLVTTEKNNYLKKLGMEVSNPRTTCKKYWTCLKRLLNKNKASIIPPILNNGVFITDIAQK